MKKIITIILISLLVAGNQSFAQQVKSTPKTDKEKQDKAKAVKKDSSKAKDKIKDVKDTANKGKGHAYGKNKGDLQGKEFGQNRAAEAKTKKDAVKNTETNSTHADSLIAGTRDKIKQARAKLETKKKDKKITDTEYAKKKKAIDDLEKEVNKVEEQNKVVKEQIKKEK